MKKYRAPFRVYHTVGWREYGDAIVIERFADIPLYGEGLYDLSEDSWYAEDANGKKVEESDIPQTQGWWEVTVFAKEQEDYDCFTGWHMTKNPMPKQRKVMRFDMTGPSMGQVDHGEDGKLWVGYGKTYEEARHHAITGKRLT